MAEMTETALRILGELPIGISSTIHERLSEDLNAETDSFADELVATLNEGQRRELAKAAIARQIDDTRRTIAARLERKATKSQPSLSQKSPQERKAERERRERECERLQLPKSATAGEMLAATMNEFAEIVKTQVRLELTVELLGSEFAVGDGSRVTWGDATAEQHTLRAETLQKQGLGTLETALRHKLAVAMLEQSGCVALAQIGVQVAA